MNDRPVNDEPNIFNLLGEQILLAAVVDRIAGTNLDDAKSLLFVSKLYYSTLKEAIDARRLIDLTRHAGEFSPNVKNELAEIDVMIAKNPMSLFKHLEINGRRTSAIKEAVANMDAYLLEKFMKVAEDNGMLLKFIKHATEELPDIDLTEDDQSSLEYMHKYFRDIDNADLYFVHREELKWDSREKLGGAQKQRRRFFFDAMCNVNKPWTSEEDNFEDVTPPDNYLALYHGNGEYIDLTEIPPDIPLSLGKNFVLMRGDGESAEIETEDLNGTVCAYDQNAWHALFNKQKHRVNKIIETAREHLKK